MEDTERTHLIESLIGISTSRRTYYSEYCENERRLDRAIASVAIISAAFCNTTSGVTSLAEAVVAVAIQHFDATWAILALNDPVASRWIARRHNGNGISFVTENPHPELEHTVEQVLASQRLGINQIDATTQMLSAPMLLSNQVVGALVVVLSTEFSLDERELSVMATLANQAAVAVANARLYEESERLRAQAFALYEDALRQKDELEQKNLQLAKARHRLATARHNEILNAERARIARDLHDSVAQHLISIGMALEWCRIQLDQPSPLYARICNAKELARSAVTRMRETIFQLAPLNDVQSNLVTTLRELALDFEKTTNLHVQIYTEGPPLTFNGETASLLYYIAQEALFNAYKHAQARSITITIKCAADAAQLIVADDGVGIAENTLNAAPGPTASATAHFGLRNMRERAQELGGHLAITCPHHGGTEVQVSIPLA